ncbi:MAG: hypothetical protein Tsb0021_09660 [Chlamydiales bacterium]
MVDQQKNILIGLFVLLALGIFSYILLFMHPTVGDEGQTIRARFANIDKVNIGTRVLFAGRPVGEVVSIQEVENARDPALLRDDKVYIYELVLKVDSAVDVYMTDEISIQTSGLLGEKSIEITPRPAEPGKPLVKLNGQPIYAEPLGSLEQAITEFTQLAKTGRDMVEKITESLDTLTETEFFENMGLIAQNIGDITTSLNKPDEWDEFIVNLSGLADNLNVISLEVREGEGSIGRLIKSDELYLRLISLLNKGETIMDDINHYGLLYQNDKGWQRLRARRANLLARLGTPREFQNFFNDEVANITTALSRINMVLNESQSELCQPVVCTPAFQKIFADLLRRVSGLEENLKLYDQQLVDHMNSETCKEVTSCN